MRTLVITTQYCENYGAHDWDGKGTCPEYWKFKGGHTYFVTAISVSDEERIEKDGIPTLTSLLEYKNAYEKEYVIGYEFRDLGKDGDGKGPMVPEWETPIEMTYDGDNWIAGTHHLFSEDERMDIRKPIIARSESWIMLPEGVRKDYERSYQTPQGWFDQDDPALTQQIKDAEKAVA